MTGGGVIFVVPRFFKDFGEYLILPTTDASGGVFGLSLLTVLWAGALALGWFILRRTFLGRSILAMGGNEIAAERLGIRTFWVRMFVFAFVGLLSGVAAIAARFFGSSSRRPR